jgi:hypothetical protein
LLPVEAQVNVLSQNFAPDTPLCKLSERFLGNFRVFERIRTKAYKLKLLPSMKVDPVLPIEDLQARHL